MILFSVPDLARQDECNTQIKSDMALRNRLTVSWWFLIKSWDRSCCESLMHEIKRRKSFLNRWSRISWWCRNNHADSILIAFKNKSHFLPIYYADHVSKIL